MISPESYILKYIDKPYEELLLVRDRLISHIRHFEKHKDEQEEVIICPSSEVAYQCNLEYLAKMCELIAKKYNQEFV